MGNTNSGPINSEAKPINPGFTNNAVTGNTEELSVKPNVTHAAFETTSENLNFTNSEPMVSLPLKSNSLMQGELSDTSEMQNYTESNTNQPYYKEYMQAKQQYLNSKKTNEMTTQNGGFILDKLVSLLQDSEEPVFTIDSKLNQIRSLLQDSEFNNNNNLVGGAVDENSQKLRELLLQDTESFINFRGGDSTKNSKMKEITEDEKEEDEKEEDEKEEKEEDEKEEKEEDEKKEKKTEEKEEVKIVPLSENEEDETSQSGGEDLDTELKVILKELQMNNKNVHKGGKSSRKSSKKSKKSKKNSRRTTTEESKMTNGTYDIDSDSSDGNEDDYLTSSTESMNTSDVNINHYRS
jgi:hypothetical protein